MGRMDQQQDASECYIHMVYDLVESSSDVREALRLPKTTLQTQVEHGAKKDVEYDHKLETEYLLDCSIPNKPPGDAVWLEECLANYFTNIVEVRRRLSSIPGDISPPINYATHPRASIASTSSYFPQPSVGDAPPPYPDNGQGRSYGGDEKAKLKESLEDPGPLQERNVAAWQFFKLLPYYAPASGKSETAINLANEKPMLGICLKRYGYDVRRQAPYRNGRRVVIPKYIELSNFVSQEDASKQGVEKQYRLVFYSTVCHRGQYVQSGHYVSIVWDRQNDMFAPDVRISCRWLHFDDIAAQKITSSTPEYLLSNETPYLLFYQLEEVGEIPKPPGIYVPPEVKMPEIPPPPSRPPPPIPQTTFAAKETNQQPPSPAQAPEYSEAYQYTEQFDYPMVSPMSPQTHSPTSYLPPPITQPPPPPVFLPPPPPSHSPPAPPLLAPLQTTGLPRRPSHPPPPPPEPDYIDMPSSPPIPHQSYYSTGAPPMPSYPPPLPPDDYPLDMPEPPAYSPTGGRLFDYEDGEQLDDGRTKKNENNRMG